MSDNEMQKGTPPMVMLPAKDYFFKILGEYKIVLPRSGEYRELDPKFFNKEDGQFNLYDEESKVMYTPAITKVLFATSKYPDLKANQLFAPLALIFEENEVQIVGQLLEMHRKKDS